MSGNFEDLIGRGVTGSKPAAGIPGRLYFDTTLDKLQRDSGASWDDCEGAGGGGGDVTWAVILASQLVNEIKNWPPCVPIDSDLDALNLWWDKFGTPSTAPTVVDVAGEGITEDYELALKIIADGANEGLYQRFTYADEPRVKAGRAFSTLWAIWCVGGVGVTLSIKDSTAAETVASEVTDAAWTIVEVPAHTLAGTYVDIILQTDGAGTFYAVPLGANIGTRGLPLAARPSRYVECVGAIALVDNVDPNGAGFQDVDATATSSPLAWKLNICGIYQNASAVNHSLAIRRNGDTTGLGNTILARNQVAAVHAAGNQICLCDDGQIIEWGTSGGAGDTESCYVKLLGWWEWG